MNIKREISKVSKKLSLLMTRKKKLMETATSHQQTSYVIPQHPFLRYFIFWSKHRRRKSYPANTRVLGYIFCTYRLTLLPPTPHKFLLFWLNVSRQAQISIHTISYLKNQKTSRRIGGILSSNENARICFYQLQIHIRLFIEVIFVF